MQCAPAFETLLLTEHQQCHECAETDAVLKLNTTAATLFLQSYVLQPTGGGGGGAGTGGAAAGAQEPLAPPEICSTPMTERRASLTSSSKQGLKERLKESVSRVMRKSKSNMPVFSSSETLSQRYMRYTCEGSPQHSTGGLSPDGSSEHRSMAAHGGWPAVGAGVGVGAPGSSSARSTAGGPTSTTGSEGAHSSLRNSRDSSEGLASSGPATAAGSESGASNTGAVVSGGGGGGSSKRRSSGSSSSAGTGALGSSEGGSVATGSSRGGADNTSGSESSGGGAANAVDSFGKKLRRSGSRGGGRGGSGQAPAAATVGGTPPTYATINELQSMTAAQVS